MMHVKCVQMPVHSEDRLCKAKANEPKEKKNYLNRYIAHSRRTAKHDTNVNVHG
jgi:hypothetical protein